MSKSILKREYKKILRDIKELQQLQKDFIKVNTTTAKANNKKPF